MNNPQLVAEILRITAYYDVREEIYWWYGGKGDVNFSIKCNDIFLWGCSDSEPIETIGDANLLEECLKKTELNGHLLYCAEKRQMRPQGAAYQFIPESEWELFNKFPEREVGLGNPTSLEDVKNKI